jgi:signal transduction histidine kinase
MPEIIRAENERLRSRPRRGGFLASQLAILLVGSSRPAYAQATGIIETWLGAAASLSGQDIAGLTLTLGLLAVAVVTAIMLVRTRARAAHAESAAHQSAAAMRAEMDRLKTVLLSEPQILFAWSAAEQKPDVTGEAGGLVPGMTPDQLLDFDSWLEPAIGHDLREALAGLRDEGRGFLMSLESRSGAPIEASGRIVGGRAVLRLREVSGTRADLAELSMRYQNLFGTAEMLRDLVDALPAPIWLRDAEGLLTFVNGAYVRTVEAKDASEAVENSVEMFDRAARDQLAASRAERGFWGRLPAITAGQRRVFDVIDTPSRRGSAGIAIDATEAAAMSSELARMQEAKRRLLDQLGTAVATFSADHRLSFYNTAYRALWELDAAFLDQSPTDSAVLERLRTAGKLPEQQNFRTWKNQLHEAYRASDPVEQMWHLPDGRTVRVVVVANPEGGVTYLFDDVTERLQLHRNYDALIKVQSETLDHLSEAVAVFASDGRIRLHNPTFERMWKLTGEALAARPHIEAVTAWCQAQHDDNIIWRNLRASVTAIDNRVPTHARIERRDGATIDCTTVPLPDGATMVTFKDITDTVNVERALRERNEALETADEIKVDFVHHVSYELRSPLTNIIGFAELLSDTGVGPLNAKQREYLSYITKSTSSLLAIINNILDLATIDAGAMTLNLGEVDIRAAVIEAAEGIQDRLVTENLSLVIDVTPDIGSFTADGARVRQVLFNLLSNAAGFSPQNETIRLSAVRRPDAIIFTVTDHGPGIPEDFQERAFELFETHAQGSQHRGPGLGLSLVRSFVELHGGKVMLDSMPGRGTKVTCSFPLEQAADPVGARPAAKSAA